MSINANKLTKELLDERVGYVVEVIASGEDQKGFYKILEWHSHPIMKETYWLLHDGADNLTKYPEWNDAIAAYNNL